MTHAFEQDGYAVLRGVIPAGLVVRIKAALASGDLDRAERRGETYGARNILDIPEVRELAALESSRGFVMGILGREVRIVRGIFFDKTPAANWPVAWHQDLSLALAEKHALEGWQAWSVKAGVAHVQPPHGLLARMMTLRFHLDDCDEDNGPLKVVPGSHAHGRLDRAAQATLRSECGERTLAVAQGDIIAMRPLILHASSSAKSPRHRRVVHLEFAPGDLLPVPLRWDKSIGVAA
jgi:hypothetical protein